MCSSVGSGYALVFFDGVFKGTVLFYMLIKVIFPFLTCGKKGKFHKLTANNVHVSRVCLWFKLRSVFSLLFFPIRMIKKTNKKNLPIHTVTFLLL